MYDKKLCYVYIINIKAKFKTYLLMFIMYRPNAIKQKYILST